MASAYEANDETVRRRVTQAATGRVVLDSYELVIRDRTPGCRGHLAFANEEEWHSDENFYLVTAEGRRIDFHLFRSEGGGWEGVVDSDSPPLA